MLTLIPGFNPYGRIVMSVLDRVESLKSKHAALEAAIDAEKRHPTADLGTINELKRKKLLIKDEIQRLNC